MNYELATELKDAGFPQKNPEDGEFDRYEIRDGIHIFKPTLEELIEACGDRFGDLGKYLFKSNDRQKDWMAVGSLDAGGSRRCKGEGSTPIEAVARLYLALNKKS